MLFYLTPLTVRRGDWVHSVLMNWHDFGFFNLKGQLVHNAGGSGLPEHPDVYSGHRAYSLYPAYFVDWIFNDCDSGLAFFLVFSAILGLSIWLLLGGGIMGAITAALIVYSASYLRMIPALDPLNLPVLFGIPFLFRVRELLNRERLTMATLAILFGIMVFYMPMNWTTIVALGITIIYLAVARPVNLKRVWGFALFSALGGAMVLAISLASRMGGKSETGATGHFTIFYNHYLIGPGGYDDNGMNWVRAAARLTVANFVALLPLWMVFLWKIWRIAQVEKTISQKLLICLSPLLAAIFFIAVLRNYFAHHPWMAGPVLIYGIVFSLRLLLDRQPEAPITAGDRRFWIMTAVPISVGFIYAIVVLAWLGANAVEMDSVLRLTDKHTPRTGIIFYSPSDPGIAQSAGSFHSLIDRQVVPLTSSNSIPQEFLGSTGERFYLSSHVLSDNPNLLAQTEIEKKPGIITSTLNWYRTHIAKRPPGGRIDMSGSLYLYRMP